MVGGAALAVLLAAGGVTVTQALRAAPAAGDSTPQPAAIAPATPAPSTDGRITLKPLGRLAAPDVVVTLPRRAADRAVERLRRRDGIRRVAVLDVGKVRLRHHRLAAVGVDPDQVRAFTPSLTATSEALWQSVARGDLALSYGLSRPFRRDLGDTVTATGDHRLPVRIGAFASLGLGRAQAVLDHAIARDLGLRPSRRLVVAAPRLSIEQIERRVRRVFGRSAHVHGTRPESHVTADVGDYARATIPASYLALYRAAAATCPGLPWTVLAGIGAVETDHGAYVHRSTKGAVGPMQFLPSTFAAYGIDGNGDGVADVHDPADAVYSAARYLCLWGAGRGGQALYDAVFAYNHADWYVRQVFTFANAYA